MDKKYFLGLILGMAFIGLLTLITHRQEPVVSSSSKIQVAASFYPLYFFAEQIGGDKVDVFNITPAGAEPHDYEPTAQDIAQIENSKLLILNGGGLEAWGDKIKQNIDSSKTKIIAAGLGLTTKTVEEEGKAITDPHVWLEPKLAETMVDKISADLMAVDSQNKEYYTENSNILKTKLENLYNSYETELSTCMDKNIITSHAAFGYMAARFGLNQIPITGLSPDSEPSSKELAQITKFAKDNHVKYIFFESLVSPKLAQTIASEVGAKTLVLNPIEGLTDQEIASGKDYFTEMQDNLANLKIALECK